MNGANERFQDWEALQPMTNGQYNPRYWEDIKYRARQTRGPFGWVTVGVRFMPTLLNRGGVDPEADRAWLDNNARTTKNVMSPDGGRTYYFVVHVKTPHVSTLLDLVCRNERYIEAYSTGRRPLVCFNNVTFSFSKHSGGMELQTLANQRGSVCPNTTITWVGNYVTLPAGYAASVLESFAAPAAKAAPAVAPAAAAAAAAQQDEDEETTQEMDGYGTEVEGDEKQGTRAEDDGKTVYEIFTQLE